MSVLSTSLQRLNVIGAYRELGTDSRRRATLIGIGSTQLLVQLSSMPVALTIPTVARYFDSTPRFWPGRSRNIT